MIVKQIVDSDVVVLHSIESYVKSMGMNTKECSPEEILAVTTSARDILYSEISQRTARLIAYVMSSSLETDTVAQGINTAMTNHFMDPNFVSILMQYLNKVKNPEEDGIIGAYIAKIISKYIEDENSRCSKPTSSTPPASDNKKKGGKKDDKVETLPFEDVPKKPNFEPIQHLQKAASILLEANTGLVITRCPSLTDAQAMAVAACISMNNQDTVPELVKSDLPITADVLNMLDDPSDVIKHVLLMSKDEYSAKLTQNQKEFLESLKRWIYFRLNAIPTQTAYQFLVSVYGNIKVDCNKYYIKLKDCGNQYPNLLEVAKALCN